MRLEGLLFSSQGSHGKNSDVAPVITAGVLGGGQGAKHSHRAGYLITWASGENVPWCGAHRALDS